MSYQKMKSRALLGLLIGACSLFSMSALAQPNTQIVATDNTTALQNALMGVTGDITVRSVEYIGSPVAVGTFEEGPLGMSHGIVMSTGPVEELSFRTPKTDPSYTVNQPGHSLCQQLTGTPNNYDAALLKIVFDLGANADGIVIDHIVGTEEYPEYVGTEYNDGFGIFLNGQNIALSVDDIPVTVNEYFAPGAPTEILEWPHNEMNLNAGTPRFATRAPLASGSTNNELLILICDAEDEALDTGAFIASFDACYGDCTRTSQCGDGILNPGEVCDNELIDPAFADCPAGYQGAPMCNNNPANPERDGSCTLDPIPYGCVDIDECADPALNDCDANATCHNTEGSHYCECDPGYEGDGEVCIPNLTLDSPANGDVFDEDRRPVIRGTGGPGQTVDIAINDVIVGSATVDADGNWSYQPEEDLPGGTVYIDVSDGYNREGVVVIVDDTAPVVIEAPSDGAILRTSRPTISGTAEPGAQVEIFIDGESAGQTTANGEGNFTWTAPTDMADGEYSARAYVESPSGGREDSVDFKIDTSTSEVVITSPEDGALLNNPQPTIQGSAAPGATVDIIMGGDVVGTVQADSNGNWSWTPAAELDDGPIHVEVVADDDGVTSRDEVEFMIDSTPPTLTVDSPRDGEEVEPGAEIVVSGTAEPGAEIIVVVNGEPAGSATADEEGNWSVPVPGELDEGEATIVVTATDDAGNSTEVERNIVVVKEELPEPEPPVEEMEVAGGGLNTCSTTPGSDPSLLFGLIILGLMALRRRMSGPRFQ